MPILKINVESGSPKIASFKACFEFEFDFALGYITNWRVKFVEGKIDLYTTSSWMNSKGHLHNKYLLKKKLFDAIGLVQKPRISTNDHDLIKLNNKQLEKTSNFFNSNQYKSTIYEIVSLFKGSNPSGANKNPNAAQIWEIDTEQKYNINIFLRYFINKKFWINRNKKQDWDQEIYDLEEYFINCPKIKKIFLLFQKSNSNDETMKRAKIYAKSLMSKNIKVEKDVAKETNKYSNNINNHYSCMSKAYDLIFRKLNNQDEPNDLEKAHILPKWFIKRQMFENIQNEQTYKNWLKMISDFYNFLPLDPNTHKAYDKDLTNKLYWNENGVLETKNGCNLKNFIRFSQINKPELTDQRKKYMQMYYLNIIDKK